MKPYPPALVAYISRTRDRTERLRRSVAERDRVDMPADERERNRRVLVGVTAAESGLALALEAAES